MPLARLSPEKVVLRVWCESRAQRNGDGGMVEVLVQGDSCQADRGCQGGCHPDVAEIKEFKGLLHVFEAGAGCLKPESISEGCNEKRRGRKDGGAACGESGSGHLEDVKQEELRNG